MEQMTGIEPAASAWEAEVLPLDYICVTGILYTMRRDLSMPYGKKREKVIAKNDRLARCGHDAVTAQAIWLKTKVFWLFSHCFFEMGVL